MTKPMMTQQKQLTAMAKEHAAWERKLAHGFFSVCEAIAHIIDDKTYRALGFKSFMAYSKARLPWAHRYSYQLRQAHMTILKLPENLRRYLTNEAQLRPLYGMKTVNQVKVIKAALKESNDGPLTPKLIAAVAEKTQKWLPKSKMKPQVKTTNARELEVLEAAFKIINNRSRSGYDTVQKLGQPFEWKGFADALKWMQDASDAAS